MEATNKPNNKTVKKPRAKWGSISRNGINVATNKGGIKKKQKANPKRYWSRRPVAEQLMKKAASPIGASGITVYFISGSPIKHT